MNAVQDAELVAPCGMNCALCSSYLALKNSLKSKGTRMPYCAGCRPRGKNCAFLKKQCAKLSNGEVAFCYKCADFPCRRLKTIDERYRSRYRTSLIENLNFIKANGIDEFLKNQHAVWGCKTCGELICCHNGVCYSCGLEKLRNKKQMYRWDE